MGNGPFCDRNLETLLVVDVGAQFQGYTFRLYPKNRLLLEELVGQPITSSSIFVSNEEGEALTLRISQSVCPFVLCLPV